MTLDKDIIPGIYTKTAIILSLILVVLTIVFANKYFKLYSRMTKLQEQTKVSRRAQPSKKKSPQLSSRAQAALSEIISHQRNAIKGLTKKNELIVANWNKEFKNLLQKKEEEYNQTLHNILKENEKKYDDLLSESKEQFNFLIDLYTTRLEALKDLVNELLPAQGVENKIRAGDLLLSLQSYELALQTYGKALDSVDDAGFEEEKAKTTAVTIHQRVATTLLLIYKSTPHKESRFSDKENEAHDKDSDTILLDGALEHLDAAVKIDNSDYETFYLQAQILNEMGAEPSSIIESLKQALSIKEIPSEQLLKDFENLKSEPAFNELLVPADKSE